MTTKGKRGSLSSSLLNITRARPVTTEGQGELFLHKPSAKAAPTAPQSAAPEPAINGPVLFRKGSASADAFRPAHWSYDTPSEPPVAQTAASVATADVGPLAWPDDEEPPPEEPPGLGGESSKRMLWMVIAGSCGIALILPALMMVLALSRNTDDVTIKPLPSAAAKAAPAGSR